MLCLLLKRKAHYPEAEELFYGDLRFDIYSGVLSKGKDKNEEILDISSSPKIKVSFVNDQSGYAFAMEGAGIAVDLPLSFIKKELSEGSLIPVLKGWRRKPWSRNLIFSSNNVNWSELKTFIKWFQLQERIDSYKRWKEIYELLAVPKEAYLEEYCG